MGILVNGEVKPVDLENSRLGSIVKIEGPITSEYVCSLKMDKQLNNFRLADKQHQALVHIAGMDPGYVFVVHHQGVITGYVTFHHPDEYGRWSRHPGVLELGCVEVSPSWRGCRLGKTLLARAFTHEVFEKYIIITTEYYWHWDIETSGLDVWSYQKMLTNLFGSVGFECRQTDDPEIMEHPANVLMVRVGSRVSQEDVDAFERLLFDTIF